MSLAARILITLLAFGAPLTGPALGQDTFESRLAEANAALARALAEHAAWCQAERAYAERDDAWERVLVLDPEHKQARRAVGYTWDRKAEVWLRKSSYRAPRPSPAPLAGAAAQRLTALDGAHLERTLPLLDAAGASTPQQRNALLAQLLALHPGHPELLRLRGWVSQGEGRAQRWALPETFLAEARRPVIHAKQAELEAAWTELAESMQRGGPTIDEPTKIEWPIDLDFGGIRVLAATSAPEAESLLRTCTITWDFASAVFGRSDPAEQTVLVAGRPPVRRRLLLALAAGDQVRYERLQRMAGDRKGSRVLIWCDDAPARLDAACRQTIAILLGRSFGIGTRHGWITEGFGMALCHRLLGTRLTYFVATNRYGAPTDRAIDDAMREPEADWLALARDALQPATRPNLAFLLGRDVNGLGATDLVIAYSLATFLIEGHAPETTLRILRRIGADEAPAVVLEQELGYGLDALGERLYDWLERP